MNNVKVKLVSGKYHFRKPGVSGLIRKRPGDIFEVPIGVYNTNKDQMVIVGKEKKIKDGKPFKSSGKHQAAERAEKTAAKAVLDAKLAKTKPDPKTSTGTVAEPTGREKIFAKCKEYGIPCKGSNEKLAGLVQAHEAAVSKNENPKGSDPDAPLFPKDLGVDKWELSNGDIFTGTYPEAVEAQKAL